MLKKSMVPEKLAKKIIKTMNDTCEFRRNVARVPMGSRSMQVPRVTGDLEIYKP